MNQASPLSLSRSVTTPASFAPMAETWYVPVADPGGLSKRVMISAPSPCTVMGLISCGGGKAGRGCLPSHAKCGKL